MLPGEWLNIIPLQLSQGPKVIENVFPLTDNEYAVVPIILPILGSKKLPFASQFIWIADTESLSNMSPVISL